MALKKYKPYTPSRRWMVGYDFSDITKTSPEKSLTVSLGRTGGRNNQGRTTSRWMGGGHKKLYRLVDFKGYDKAGIPAKVASIEYDPYRTSRIALLNYADGEKRYVLAWKGITVGDEVMSGETSPITPGNRKQLKDIPEGVQVHCLEVTPFSKGKIIKTAGSSALISGRDEAEGLVFIKMPSGEVRKFNQDCWATIGVIGNEQHKNVVIGKAGRQRWLGKKPRVLGKNMNPVDHPHGGGEAHSPIGSKRGQKSFSGKRVSAGMKTRQNKKWSTKFIVSRRKK
ncbi:MAG: 50S ribosomal protein L2 [Candidatus Absconditabacteria bacterium]|nr:50S ribosomal protein L2 [Candidatus Absconditabacteria bacterium]MDD3868406.1 50S ribosomal protein L2 [Candidatus Absconditabacteria bacterium]MDD4714070.1 50S ribosomal protein L2 [Candidatus Absconditabacteria bacterium]